MLAKLVARNYRSLELAQIDLAPLTALVGPNGAGKSAILRALDFVMGQRYQLGGRSRGLCDRLHGFRRMTSPGAGERLTRR